MPEPPEPPSGYKAIPMNNSRGQMLGRGLALYLPWALILYASFGSLRGIPVWLSFLPVAFLFIWEFADMVWWNFQRLHERLDVLEAKLPKRSDDTFLHR
jgi:hypothetical protein